MLLKVSPFQPSPDEELVFGIFHVRDFYIILFIIFRGKIINFVVTAFAFIRADFCILDPFFPVAWLQLALLFGNQSQICDILRDVCSSGSGVMN